jgi:uracil-DNA glycosylase
VTADDLPSAFDALPPQWRELLPGWTPVLQDDVVARARAASGARLIAPADPFRALRLVSPQAVKVVLFGQDPYPGEGVADGLAFSAARGKPPSLRRVFEVLEADRPGYTRPEVWQLDCWAHQGVLLLNPVLSIEVGRIGSHIDCGWQALTSQVVELLCRQDDAPVFLLWGSHAQRFFAAACPLGHQPPVLSTRHPSNDFQRRFMSEGSHFVATADRVDWWAP